MGHEDGVKYPYCHVYLTQNERHSHSWEIQSNSWLSCPSLDCGREAEQLEEGLGVRKVDKLLSKSYSVSSGWGNLDTPRTV